MREIVLDTETTGLDPASGHRIVEIGCVELVDRLPSGQTFQKYINPEREMSGDAQAIHGLTDEFLRGQPLFSDVAAEFLDFIADSPLVIHNADFDLGFVNMELQRVGFAVLHGNRAIDTVLLARRKFPGAPASLDALCKRFAIDNSGRELHGALLDASLLAEVYLELTGGRQTGLKFGGGPAERGRVAAASAERPWREPRPHDAGPEEQAAHAALLAKIKNPIWGT